MRSLHTFGFVMFTALAPVMLGCAADAGEEASSSEGAVSADDRAIADAALGDAEFLAEQHLDGNFCDAEDDPPTTARVLARLRDAVRANKTSAFKKEIARNETIRKAVGQTLEYAELTGALTVDGGVVSGLTRAVNAVEKIELYGPAPGIYGNMARLELRAGFKGTLHRLNLDDNGDVTWSSVEVSYAERTSPEGTEVVLGTPTGTQTFRLIHIGDDDRFKLISLDGDPGLDFDSLPSECEA